MSTSVASLYCPQCGTANLESQPECQSCSAVLPKRYLWAVGDVSLLEAADLNPAVKERFVAKAPKVFLDTQPGMHPPDAPAISTAALPYLRLFAYRLHIPQIYAVFARSLSSENGTSPGVSEVLLLEQAPLNLADVDLMPGLPSNPKLIGTSFGTAEPILSAWGSASLARQLNWLWQMAQLWQPMALEGVVTSLLQPELLRVEGPLLRLRELSSDQIAHKELKLDPQLPSLGRLWQRWLPTTQIALQPGLETLCDQLIDGTITSAEQMIPQLDQWLELATRGVDGSALPLRFSLTTQSDQGPSRKRNEDACYPTSGSLITDTTQCLTIVCDGVGGHAGGDVASSLAISTIESHLTQLDLAMVPPPQIEGQLAAAICAANDQICQKNDAENRQERQRMGTTVVLALTQHHQVYFAHVGDSRAYWINRHGCYQITLDDDVACREVRLGYTLYREVLQHPIAGSLVQALGMSASDILRPNISRWLLDEDCVFLLCSDGLSDYDRVEESWHKEILPLLNRERDLPSIRERLIELANTSNGHDNVTISLLHCQVNPQALLAQTETGQIISPLPEPSPTLLSQVSHPALIEPTVFSPHDKKNQEDIDPRERNPFITGVLVMFLLATVGLIGYLCFPLLRQWLPASDPTSSPSGSPTLSPGPLVPANTGQDTPQNSPRGESPLQPGLSPSPESFPSPATPGEATRTNNQ